jgi:hypothetical protein
VLSIFRISGGFEFSANASIKGNQKNLKPILKDEARFHCPVYVSLSGLFRQESELLYFILTIKLIIHIV